MEGRVRGHQVVCSRGRCTDLGWDAALAVIGGWRAGERRRNRGVERDYEVQRPLHSTFNVNACGSWLSARLPLFPLHPPGRHCGTAVHTYTYHAYHILVLKADVFRICPLEIDSICVSERVILYFIWYHNHNYSRDTNFSFSSVNCHGVNTLH